MIICTNARWSISDFISRDMLPCAEKCILNPNICILLDIISHFSFVACRYEFETPDLTNQRKSWLLITIYRIQIFGFNIVQKNLTRRK